MRSWPQCFVRVAAAAAILAVAAAARAETWTLELKRLEQNGRQGAPPGYMARPQSFYGQIGGDGKTRVQFAGSGEQTAAFKRIVTKEPKYESERPFRGVAKLGSRQFAFALDIVLPAAPEPEKKRDAAAKPEATEKKPATKPKAKSGAAIVRAAGKPSRHPPAPKVVTHGRLYFDLNGNGDLTDDKVIEVDCVQQGNANFLPLQFPQINVPLDVDGTKLDYSFQLSGYVSKSPNFSLIALSLTAAAYRQGDITVEGKKHHVVLIDANSNGRFDDAASAGRGGNLTEGDLLLVDSNVPGTKPSSAYDARRLVSKLVNIDGRFYDLHLSPAGDKLTLTPSSLPLGNVTNPNDGFHATVYSEKGVLSISGDKDTPVPLPEGQWRLLSYTLDRTGQPKPAAAGEKKEGAEKRDAPPAGNGVPEVLRPTARYQYTTATAQATAEYKPIRVRGGETVTMPFGPPYTPTVTAAVMSQGKNRQAMLLMSLIGSAGERCTGLIVDGGRPPKPEFTITDPQGKVVQTGNFEYG